MSELVAAAENGDELIVAWGGQPVVRIVPATGPKPVFRIGLADGAVQPRSKLLRGSVQGRGGALGLEAVLLDTHVWIWSLFRSSDLHTDAQRIIKAARTVYVPPCSFQEIVRTHRSGRWPEVSAIVGRLPRLLRAQGGTVAPYTAEMAVLSGGMEWTHRGAPRSRRPHDCSDSQRTRLPAHLQGSDV